MQRYLNSVQDIYGNAINGASVTVWTNTGRTVAASLYSDNGITPIVGNTVTADSLGEFAFYAADGRYYLTAQKAGVTTQFLSDILLFDPAASTGAAGVGFIQSGTGALTETVQDAERRIPHTAQYLTQGNFDTAKALLSGTHALNNLYLNGTLTLNTQTQAQQIAIARTLGLPYILAQSGVAVSCPADTNEDTLASITVPANAMGINGSVRITTLWAMTSSGNNKALRIKFGGTSFYGVNRSASAGELTLVEVFNMGATNSQEAQTNGSGSYGANAAANTTAAIDTTAAVTILITGQKATAGETLTLKSYRVELFPS